MSQHDEGRHPHGQNSPKKWFDMITVRLAIVAVIGVTVAAGIMQVVQKPPASHATSGTVMSGWVTFYSAPDNDPPGSHSLAYPGPAPRHAKAGGTGTYDDPQTFATAHPDVYPVGTRIYVPRVQRYYIMEDLCACSHGANHVDLWLAPSGTDSQIVACERALTTAKKKETIIKDPDSDLPVNLSPLINNGACRVP